MSRHPSFKPPGGLSVKRMYLKDSRELNPSKEGQWKEGDKVVSLKLSQKNNYFLVKHHSL